MLSIDAEKPDEAKMHNTIINAVKLLEPLEATLVEYTSYTNRSASVHLTKARAMNGQENNKPLGFTRVKAIEWISWS